MTRTPGSSGPPRLAVVMGSTRRGRFCDTVTGWVLQRVQAFGACTVEVVDPALLPAPDAPDAASIARLARADGFVVVTPEYNHGYTASLKALIDAVSTPWRAKPVAFVSYGGRSGGLRAVEQLRLVFAELDAATLRDTVSFADASRLFDTDGALITPADAEAAMDRLLRTWCWWAKALRTSREAIPYERA